MLLPSRPLLTLDALYEDLTCRWWLSLLPQRWSLVWLLGAWLAARRLHLPLPLLPLPLPPLLLLEVLAFLVLPLLLLLLLLLLLPPWEL